MELQKLVNESARLINQASKELGQGYPGQAKSSMTKLCKLLYDHPELRAGDDTKTPAGEGDKDHP